ncbi:MAG: cyclically-permuted mutarotase family protein [Tannerellaceae bacterium]
MKRILTFILLCLLCLPAAFAVGVSSQPDRQVNKIKVACVGNSVTYGYLLEDRENNCYPAQLQRLLGNGYEVSNFGKSGATLLAKGHRPYREQEEFRAAMSYAADRVVIHLGLNDTDPRNWPNYRDEFVGDYLALVDSLRSVNPRCEVWVCRMTPIFHTHSRFKSGTRDWHAQIQKAIEEVARVSGATLIDLHEPLYNRPDLFPDALHPNTEGAGILARTVYSALTGDYGGLKLPAIYSDNMVLQRGKPLTLSGTADRGEVIRVSLPGQKQQAVAGANGKWQVELSPLVVGAPFTLRVSTPTRTLAYKNVLVGEVWLCSGQSNMAFRLDESVESEQLAQQTYAAHHPKIRLFDSKPRVETNAVEWDASVLDSLNRQQYYKDTHWTECSKQTAARFSAIAFAFGRMLADSLQVPVGLILNAVGGSPAEAWIDRHTLEFQFPDILYDWTKNDFIQEWARGRAALNVKKSVNPAQRHPYEPCYLYEAGIRPLEHFPIRGVIWYQGESNAHNIEAHEQLFPLLIDSWRRYWGSELPFYYVQLSSLDRPSWPRFRDSQRRLMDVIPFTGMAVSSDCGDSLNVHPTHKREVGERLAHWALSKTYGCGLVPSGPLYRQVEFRGGAAYLSFDYAAEMHTADGEPLRTFEIAGTDGCFVPAQATVVDGQIKVWSDRIANPGRVRYGWQPFTRANLVNAEGLPASTFLTDAQRVGWTKLPDLPGIADSIGVSAPFAGIHNGQLIVAGGCNFPDKPVTEGGAKRYYSEVFTLDIDQVGAKWKVAGCMPYPVAYGASAVTPEGLICIGGNNSDSSLVRVCCLSWNDESGAIDSLLLPSLPLPMDNLSAVAVGHIVYVAGGNYAGEPSNRFLCLDLKQLEKSWQPLQSFPGAARVQPVLMAQQTAEGMCLYLAGGFQPIINGEAPAVPTELLTYHPATKQWTVDGALPAFKDGTLRTFTGGCGVAYGDSSLLLMGGVNRDLFLAALDRPRQIEQAKATGNRLMLDSLQAAGKAYMHHDVAWYRFNTSLLQYNTFTRSWESLGEFEPLARAGAGIALHKNQLFIINGELKPGIRTPQVNRAKFINSL